MTKKFEVGKVYVVHDICYTVIKRTEKFVTVKYQTAASMILGTYSEATTRKMIKFDDNGNEALKVSEVNFLQAINDLETYESRFNCKLNAVDENTTVEKEESAESVLNQIAHKEELIAACDEFISAEKEELNDRAEKAAKLVDDGSEEYQYEVKVGNRIAERAIAKIARTEEVRDKLIAEIAELKASLHVVEENSAVVIGSIDEELDGSQEDDEESALDTAAITLDVDDEDDDELVDEAEIDGAAVVEEIPQVEVNTISIGTLETTYNQIFEMARFSEDDTASLQAQLENTQGEIKTYQNCIKKDERNAAYYCRLYIETIAKLAKIEDAINQCGLELQEDKKDLADAERRAVELQARIDSKKFSPEKLIGAAETFGTALAADTITFELQQFTDGGEIREIESVDDSDTTVAVSFTALIDADSDVDDEQDELTDEEFDEVKDFFTEEISRYEDEIRELDRQRWKLMERQKTLIDDLDAYSKRLIEYVSAKVKFKGTADFKKRGTIIKILSQYGQEITLLCDKDIENAMIECYVPGVDSNKIFVEYGSEYVASYESIKTFKMAIDGLAAAIERDDIEYQFPADDDSTCNDSQMGSVDSVPFKLERFSGGNDEFFDGIKSAVDAIFLDDIFARLDMLNVKRKILSSEVEEHQERIKQLKESMRQVDRDFELLEYDLSDFFYSTIKMGSGQFIKFISQDGDFSQNFKEVDIKLHPFEVRILPEKKKILLFGFYRQERVIASYGTGEDFKADVERFAEAIKKGARRFQFGSTAKPTAVDENKKAAC